jgi:hypothetical protein
VVAALVSVLLAANAAEAQSAAADRVGSAHVAGAYSFGPGDFLNEGAERVLETGMRVIKVYLLRPQVFYPVRSAWPPQFSSMVETAEHPHFRDLFAKPFHTYVLTAYSTVGEDEHYFRRGVTNEEYAAERAQFEELARHLLTAYRGTGKTFVLSNWEGDWALRGTFCAHPDCDPAEPAISGMTRWFNARQEGVDRARRAIAGSDVRVYHACEVNLVVAAMYGQRTVTNDVLPRTRCDLYSYSAYDAIATASDDPELGWSRSFFRMALDYLQRKAPDSAAFGARNVMIGEFGWPEVASAQDPDASSEKSLRVIRMTVEEGLDWGCPYLLYWQVYDNEARVRPPGNDDVRGFYLVRPDGSSAAARQYFQRLLETPERGRPRPPRTPSGAQ